MSFIKIDMYDGNKKAKIMLLFYMDSIYWTSQNLFIEFHSCISVNKENLGRPICQYGVRMADFKKWREDPSNGGDDFEMEGDGGGSCLIMTFSLEGWCYKLYSYRKQE